MSAQGIPVIGQQDAAISQLRLHLAGTVLPHLAAIAFARAWQAAVDKDQATGGDGNQVEFHINGLLVGQAAQTFADGLLVVHGILKMPERSDND
jgi:hypothetical protein